MELLSLLSRPESELRFRKSSALLATSLVWERNQHPCPLKLSKASASKYSKEKAKMMSDGVNVRVDSRTLLKTSGYWSGLMNRSAPSAVCVGRPASSRALLHCLNEFDSARWARRAWGIRFTSADTGRTWTPLFQRRWTLVTQPCWCLRWTNKQNKWKPWKLLPRSPAQKNWITARVRLVIWVHSFIYHPTDQSSFLHIHKNLGFFRRNIGRRLGVKDRPRWQWRAIEINDHTFTHQSPTSQNHPASHHAYDHHKSSSGPSPYSSSSTSSSSSSSSASSTYPNYISFHQLLWTDPWIIPRAIPYSNDGFLLPAPMSTKNEALGVKWLDNLCVCIFWTSSRFIILLSRCINLRDQRQVKREGCSWHDHLLFEQTC